MHSFFYTSSSFVLFFFAGSRSLWSRPPLQLRRIGLMFLDFTSSSVSGSQYNGGLAAVRLNKSSRVLAFPRVLRADLMAELAVLPPLPPDRADTERPRDKSGSARPALDWSFSKLSSTIASGRVRDGRIDSLGLFLGGASRGWGRADGDRLRARSAPKDESDPGSSGGGESLSKSFGASFLFVVGTGERAPRVRPFARSFALIASILATCCAAQSLRFQSKERDSAHCGMQASDQFAP